MPRRFTDRELALYRNRQGENIPVPKERKKSIGPSESQIQQQLIRWWAVFAANSNLDAEYLIAFPLQGQRSARNGARMKAEGMRAGTPDMFVAVPRGKYHGAWLELKTEVGRPTPAQKDMLRRLDQQGYAASVAYGYDDAVRFIEAYMRGEEFF